MMESSVLFSAAGRPHDAHELPLLYSEADVLEGCDFPVFGLVFVADVLYAQNLHGALPSPAASAPPPRHAGCNGAPDTRRRIPSVQP